MKFIYSDSLDAVDPLYNFARGRTAPGRRPVEGDAFAHELMDRRPYDGLLVSRATVGTARRSGKYTMAQAMRFHREGARRFLRYSRREHPDSVVMGDCGSFAHADSDVPFYGAADTAAFYADGGFDCGCSSDALIFDFDPDDRRAITDVPGHVRTRYESTIGSAREFLREARAIQGFTPMGTIQGWNAASMGRAARELVAMGYGSLAVGGMVPLTATQIDKALRAVRLGAGPGIDLHVLGFGKPDGIGMLLGHGVTSIDTTAPLLRAIKDARKNMWMRDGGTIVAHQAIRMPLAIESPRLMADARMGRFAQEDAQAGERDAMRALRAYGCREGTIDDAIAGVSAYRRVLRWTERSGTAEDAILAGARRTLEARPWEACGCRACRDAGVEIVLHRGTNHNKRRGMHNMAVFRAHVADFAALAANAMGAANGTSVVERHDLALV